VNDQSTRGTDVSADPLALDRETMRRMGYEAIDLLVDRLDRLPAEPVLRTATRAEMQARLDEPAPSAPGDFSALLARLDRDVLPFGSHWDHPRNFSYIPGSGTWPAALGDLIAAASNIDAGAYREAAGATQLELTVLEWFREWIGYPQGAGGALVSGGSAANLTAIACAREVRVGSMRDDIVIYAGDQSHSSIARAARHLGFRPDQVRIVPTDAALRMRPDDLASAMAADERAGRRPFLVAAVAGSTNTGAVDPLPAIAAVARAHGAWLHVDAAYGGFAALTERGRAQLEGLDLADSVTLDPHKWLLMPFEVGCLMVREPGQLERAFSIHPAYLAERTAGDGEVDFADRGLQLTRATRAIKVWLALQTFGVDAYRAAIDRAMDFAVAAQRRIEGDSRLELVSPAQLGIVAFRCRAMPGEGAAENDRRNAEAVARTAASGDLLVTATQLHGRYAIRMCVLNHATGADDVAFAIDRIAAEGKRLAAEATARLATRTTRSRPMPKLARPGPGPLDVTGLRHFDPFAAVSDDQAARFLAAGREQCFERGDTVTQLWEDERTMYLVLDGTFSARVGGREVNLLGPGDYFGEIASLEWGRDFRYQRTATVVAEVPSRVVAVPGTALRELMAESPDVDRVIRSTAQTRLLAR
jgi:glutamate/tyrosine decarboxylase-like PLP-dependent enzyme